MRARWPLRRHEMAREVGGQSSRHRLGDHGRLPPVGGSHWRWSARDRRHALLITADPAGSRGVEVGGDLARVHDGETAPPPPGARRRGQHFAAGRSQGRSIAGRHARPGEEAAPTAQAESYGAAGRREKTAAEHRNNNMVAERSKLPAAIAHDDAAIQGDTHSLGGWRRDEAGLVATALLDKFARGPDGRHRRQARDA